MYIPCEASSWTLLHQNRKLSSRISLQNQLFCLCRLPAVQLFDLNARIQQLTWSLIFYEKYSTSLSTIVLVVLTTANFGVFSNFYRYYTRSQTGKSTGYRPTLKPLVIYIYIYIYILHSKYSWHMFKNCVWFGNDAWDNSRHIFKSVFVFNVYVGIKGRWACPICNVCVIIVIHIYIGQLFILHIVIYFSIFVFSLSKCWICIVRAIRWVSFTYWS